MKKLILLSLMIASFSHAEIVKNSKGEKVELKNDGTWVLIGKSNSTKIENGKEFFADVADGSGKLTKIKVYAKVDNGPIRLFSQSEVIEKIRSTAEIAKIGLKNKYSFVPKVAYVEQEGTGLTINLEYTGENSYGAATVGQQKSNYALDSNDKLKMY